MAEILIVDDQDRYADLCRRAMPEHHFVGPARSYRDAAKLLRSARGRVDAVLLDVHFDIQDDELVEFADGPRDPEELRRTQGIAILARIRESWPDLPVVLLTSRDEVSLDTLPGDQEYTYFFDDEAVDAQTLRGQIESIVAGREAMSEGPVYWGRSPRMHRLRRRLATLARGRLPVVLLGPTGTGKSLIARHFVHQRSGRSGRFVAVDLSTIPSDLGAAHLFGAVKGAYTGSTADRMGAFEAASGGTLFLDEVGNLSPDAQKMLLTVLQESCVVRLGDLRERAVDVKLVVATNEDLASRVAKGEFRADLFMRLNPAAAITLPPLEDRGLELGHLLTFCLDQALQRPYLRGLVEEYRSAANLPGTRVTVVPGGRAPPSEPGVLHLVFPDRTMGLLQRHHWPGNLREFSMVAENAALFALSELTAVPPGMRPDVVQVRPKLVQDLLATAPAAHPPSDGVRMTVTLRPQETLNKVAVDCERQYFEALFHEHDGDFGRMAAQLLGDGAQGRKIQLRFNQLGLRVRDLKKRRNQP
ncbi:MAG: sigma 54-interacting transcriptional regulator [Myxococcota bacterium]